MLRAIAILLALITPTAVFGYSRYGRLNSLWVQAKYFKGFQPSTGKVLDDAQVLELAETLKTNNIRYAYLFAGPFDTDGHLPSYATSATARRSLELLRQHAPDVVFMPWVGGLQNKQVFVQDSRWVANAIQSTKLLMKTLKTNWVHVNFEYVLFGTPPDESINYGQNVQAFFDQLRSKLPHSKISTVVTSTAPGTRAWKYKHTLEEVERLAGVVDQISFLYFDTSIHDQALFRKNMSIQIDQFADLKTKLALKPVELLFGTGTFLNTAPEVQIYRDLSVENIDNHLKTLTHLLDQKDVLERRAVDGIAIFCDWQTDEAEWKQIRNLWSNRVSVWDRELPEPVKIDSSGRMVLLKTRHQKGFDLLTYDTSTQKTRRIDRSNVSQLSLTWSPDSQKIAYQSKLTESKQYELKLINLAGSPKKIRRAPPSASAIPPLYWSPNSKLIAYPCLEDNDFKLYLIDASNRQGPKEIGRGLGAQAPGAWSKDGRRFAFIREKPTRAIVVFDTVNKTSSERLLDQDFVVKQISWQGMAALFTVSRSSTDAFFQIYYHDLVTPTVTPLTHGTADVQSLVVRGNLNSIVFAENRRGVDTILELNTKNGAVTEILPGDKNGYELLGLGADLKTVFALRPSLTTAPAMVRIDTINKSTKLLYDAPEGYALEIKAREQISLGPTSPGDKFDVGADFWTPATTTKPRKAMVLIHGGPHLQSRPYWSPEILDLTQNGWAVISLNYRGSTGFGRQFEEADDKRGQAADVLAAVSWLHKHLSLPYGSIYLMGSSYGASLAIEAMRNLPETLGGVVLQAALPDENNQPIKKNRPKVILAFHGEQDPISGSAETFTFLSALFGRDFFWRVFSDEGHSFQTAEARASMYEKISTLP